MGQNNQNDHSIDNSKDLNTGWLGYPSRNRQPSNDIADQRTSPLRGGQGSIQTQSQTSAAGIWGQQQANSSFVRNRETSFAQSGGQSFSGGNIPNTTTAQQSAAWQSRYTEQQTAGSQSAFQGQQPAGSQYIFQGQQPTGSQSAFQGQQTTGSQSAFQGQQTTGSQSAFQGQPSAGSQYIFQGQQPAGSQSAFQRQPSSGSQYIFQGQQPQQPTGSQSAFQGQPSAGSQSAFQGQQPAGSQSAFQGQQPAGSQSAFQGQQPTSGQPGYAADWQTMNGQNPYTDRQMTGGEDNYPPFTRDRGRTAGTTSSARTRDRRSRTGGAEPNLNNRRSPESHVRDRSLPSDLSMPEPDLTATARKRQSEVLYGDTLRMDVPFIQGTPSLFLRGTDGRNLPVRIPFTDDLLSRHIMLLGGIGTGKTNAFFQMIDQLQYSLTENDIMIIFDTKGDFYQEFFNPGDVVISNDQTAVGPNGRKNYWNIFNEINHDYEYESVLEISKSLFAEECKRTTQIFFPNAARDIFMACMLHFLRSIPPKQQTNKNLVSYINSSTSADLRKMIESYPDLRAMSSYISKDDSAQTQGVLSELQQVIRNIFVGNFAKTGNLGLSRLVRAKGGKKIFIEYDLSLGEMLTPVYSLMFDMAIKQALGRSRSEGNVYFITDEFRLLPNLVHIDDAVNFGRSLGIKFMIGIQNVEQIFENYGEYRARSILSGFLSSFNFRVNDARSREYIKDQFGKNRKLEAYVPILQNRGMVEEQREASVVEDWDVTNLGIGQAIIGLPGYEPFILKFDRFESQN